MAFDMGFDFRFTSGYVTDPAFGVPVLKELFPHTYTNGNGLSINAGWDVAPNSQDSDNTFDSRIAGTNWNNNDGANKPTFKVDLSSGSAPGAGLYQVDLAVGDAAGARKADFKLFDSTTLLIDGTNGGAGFATAAGHFIDATLTDVTGGATWNGTKVNKTFATTTPKVQIAIDNIGGITMLSHFRLTLQAASGAAGPRSLMLLGVGA